MAEITFITTYVSVIVEYTSNKVNVFKYSQLIKINNYIIYFYVFILSSDVSPSP